jgi:histidine ammonia-lyase
MTLVIDNNDLTLQDFMNVTENNYKVELGANAKIRIKESREVVKNLIKQNIISYGVTTGFGSLSNVHIPQSELNTLQHNLIVSSAVGVGDTAPQNIILGMYLLRLKCISNGNSGVRLSTTNKIIEALNKKFIPYVPIQGTLGASGDLCPLSHLFLGLLGEGHAYDVETNKYTNAKIVLDKLKIEPLTLKAKEGLGLINGTQFITSYMAYTMYHALRIIKLSSIIAATTIEALHGVINAFDERIHQVKPHIGQIHVAKEIKDILSDSEIISANLENKVQDAYSLRCIPQVHGPVYDLIKFVESHVLIEMNCSNDNPLILNNDVVSGGNFHGMYMGMGADQLAYAFSILCNISERRTERMINCDLNGFLPKFLISNPGLNSGFMLVQYTSAGLTAENRQLAMPGSVSNIPSCQGMEDIVSMAGWPCRKAVISMKNTYNVLALELFTAIQALEFTKKTPNKISEKLVNHIRKTVPFIENDTYMGNYINYINDFLKSDDIFELIKL